MVRLSQEYPTLLVPICLSQGFYSCTNIMTKKQVGEERVYSAYTSTLLFITKGPSAYWDEENGDVIMTYQWNDAQDETALMMEAKDLVLQNLKEGKIVSLDVMDVENVTVLVNPESRPDVKLVF